MRVGVIHNLSPGGAHRRLREQLARLDADVVEVCPATASPIRADAHMVPLRPLAPPAPRALRPPLRYVDFAALLRAWARVGRTLSEQGVDVVYANPCRYLQAPAALLTSLPASLYFCDEPRRVDTEHAARASRNPITRPIYAPMYRAQRQLDRRAAARAARLATNSAFTAEQIWGAYRRRAAVIPMGVPDECFAVEPRAPAHVLSVGTLIPSKGHEIAIAGVAAAKHRWPLVIVAQVPDAEECKRLRRIAREAGVQLDVRVGLSDRELAETYAAAHATLYMAAREPFGLASLEAQATGSPVIVANEGGLPETIEHGRTGWAVSRTAAAVAERLDMLESIELRDAISVAARANAGDRRWVRSARAVQAILEHLCAS